MRTALRAEWTKLRTTAGAAWLLVATVALTIAPGAVLPRTLGCPRGGCGLDLVLGGVPLAQALVAVLAVSLIAGEYGTGLVRATVSATPGRATVLAAKAAVLVGSVAAAGGVAVPACLLITRPPAGGPTPRAAVGSVAYLVLIALLGLGIAAAVRDSAASTAVVLGLLYLPLLLARSIANPHWQRLLDRLGPMNAGLAVQATTGAHGPPLPPWAGLGVLAAWSVAALLTGALRFHRADL